jgi:cephalosporin hydroxylase
MNKNIISKKKFYFLNSYSANKMSKDSIIQKEARKVLVLADKKYRWLHQTKWMDEPCLNLPEDMFALQEIVWKTKPDFIIETGIAWGGSILFGASLLRIFGGKKIIGVDTFVPDNVKAALSKDKKLLKFIKIIKGDSVSDETVKKIKKIISHSKKVLVILDSNHTHDHVMKELLIYSKFVSKDNYLICGDTIVEFIPKQSHRPRSWGPGNNPYTALKKFLKIKNNRFIIDHQLCAKLLFTNHPNGYLLAKK